MSKKQMRKDDIQNLEDKYDLNNVKNSDMEQIYDVDAVKEKDIYTWIPTFVLIFLQSITFLKKVYYGSILITIAIFVSMFYLPIEGYIGGYVIIVMIHFILLTNFLLIPTIESKIDKFFALFE